MSVADPHPLDECDPDACDAVMRAERTQLITAKRESEDNLVKAIVQLASALIVLAAGFVSQTSKLFTPVEVLLLALSLICLCSSIALALLEQRLSAKAYEKQIIAVTEYYTKKTTELKTPIVNGWVERALNASFGLFLLGLVLVAVFAFGRSTEQKNGSATSSQSASSKA